MGMNTSVEKLGEAHVQKQGVAIDEPIWVLCDGFRCLAYLDHKGEWRAFSTGEKLPKVLKVLTDSIFEVYPA